MKSLMFQIYRAFSELCVHKYKLFQVHIDIPSFTLIFLYSNIIIVSTSHIFIFRFFPNFVNDQKKVDIDDFPNENKLYELYLSNIKTL